MLYLHRSERADQLVEALWDVIAQPLADPMAREVVAVPTRGVERWLAQRLSHRLGAGPALGDGVCANVEFPFPGTLVARAISAGYGLPDDEDPWPPERSVWPLLELVDTCLDQEFLEPLAAHLRAASPPGPPSHPVRRFVTVRHLAELYDHYAIDRPEMLLSWALGDVPPGHSWQAELWRRLRARVGVPSPAERHEAAWARLVADPALADLPARVSLFGLTRLPASYLLTFNALACGRDVHLFLLHPSAVLWDKVALRPRPCSELARDEDTTGELATNPLLRSWGRDAREMQLVLAAHGTTGGEHRPVPREASFGSLGGPTLLSLVQDGIRDDRPPPGPPRPGEPDLRPVLRHGDDSLRVHACHGKLRQVEILRDAVLHLLAGDPTLEPRDVIVMCPDIEAFAPLVQAVFGTHAAPAELRAKLADRSLRQTNPLLAVASNLLELAGSRVTASQVLEFAAREPVSRRFGFDEDELAQVQRWLAASGARWGLDAEHRERWGLGGVEANTWRASLDRLLLGVAMTEDGYRLFGEVLPFDDIPGSSFSLVGRLAEMQARLRDAVRKLAGPQAVGEWASALLAATEELAEPDQAEAWQHEQLRRTLEGVVTGSGRSPALLDLSEARSLLADKLRGRPTRANFRTGDLTVCTLLPMRSVPHRVVCLLGMDDAAFPRHRAPDGDDLLLASPRVGERDAHSEDRQLLLDAVLAATDHLVVTYQGRDPRTNQPCPPAVPVDELLDIVDRLVRGPAGRPRARDMVVVNHPLQAFDPRNFTDGGLAAEPAGQGPAAGPWGFDLADLAGAQALAEQGRHAMTFLSRQLSPHGGDVVQLEALVRFLEHPVKAFLSERLDLYLSSGPGPVPDDMPVELGSLELWGLGDRLLAAQLSGATEQEAESAELARGLLPPGQLAATQLAEVRPAVAALIGAFRHCPSSMASPRTVQVDVRLPDGRSLAGTVTGLRDRTLMRCLYSRLGPKHRLAAWARLLALSAALPGQDLRAVTIGRGPGRGNATPLITTSTLGPLTAPEALEALGVLVDLYDRAMREPLPLYCATSAQWAVAKRRGDDPFEPAKSKWETTFDLPGEDQDEAHLVALGGIINFRQVLGALPAPDERGPGWAEDEGTRFGLYACRLWDPLLQQEDLRVEH